MTEFILCCAAGFLLLWVVVLKMEISALQKNQEELMNMLKRHIKEMTGDVEVTTVLRGWGKKVKLDEVDTSWVQKRDNQASKPMKIF